MRIKLDKNATMRPGFTDAPKGTHIPTPTPHPPCKGADVLAPKGLSMETRGFATPTQVLLEPLRGQEPGSRRVGGAAGQKAWARSPEGWRGRPHLRGASGSDFPWAPRAGRKLSRGIPDGSPAPTPTSDSGARPHPQPSGQEILGLENPPAVGREENHLRSFVSQCLTSAFSNTRLKLVFN